MATYKAEFLSHYYERRLRPRYAYASGLIYWWSRAAARMPATANFFTQTPGLSTRRSSPPGIRRNAQIPPFAPETFKQWFARRGVRNAGKPPVMSVAGYVQQSLHAGRSPRRRSRCWNMRAIRCASRREVCAAAGRCTTTACSIRAKRMLRDNAGHAARADSRRHSDRRPGAELHDGVPR